MRKSRMKTPPHRIHAVRSAVLAGRVLGAARVAGAGPQRERRVAVADEDDDEHDAQDPEQRRRTGGSARRRSAGARRRC